MKTAVKVHGTLDLTTWYWKDAVYERDVGYTVDNEAIDAREAIVEGRTALEKTVRIKSFKQGEKVTRLEVYVAGDKEAAKELLNAIEKEAG